ncbi:MAG: RNA-binding protein [Bacteroidetes bacterium]|nr:RNA-binding protein [Bacteroidota bacterium]
MNIYVSNLNYRLSEEELSQLFASYGEVSSVKIVKDRETNRSKGFGFVEMPDENAAQQAINSLNNTDVGGRKIIVNKARPPKRREG